MKTRDELIKELEDQVLIRLAEVDSFKRAIEALNDGNGHVQPETKELIKKQPQEYPINGSLMDKLHYFEDIDLRIWKKSDMLNMIKDAEPDFSEDKRGSCERQLIYLVKTKKVVKIKFCNSKIYCFYTTRKNWIEKVPSEDGEVFKVIDRHMPSADLLSNLSPEQLSPEKITWEGIN